MSRIHAVLGIETAINGEPVVQRPSRYGAS